MSNPYFSLSCDFYKQHLISGFTRLQEQQEFVDLTLAADGYMVKVHKNVMALASPYIKDILKKSSSDNLVIYLNNVSHNVLSYLLEYIYQGEVNIPQDDLESFMQLARSLRITGMAKPNSPKVQRLNTQTQPMNSIPMETISQDNKSSSNVVSSSNVAACITINNDLELDVQQFSENIPVTDMEGNNHCENVPVRTSMETTQNNFSNVESQENGIERNQTNNIDDYLSSYPVIQTVESHANLPTIQLLNDPNANSEEAGLMDLNNVKLDKESVEALKIISQYSVTERGSVEIIVNRYVYQSHHSSCQGRKHRWRCVDYRKKRCPAFIDSLDGHMVQRKGVHVHSFHDDRIYKKHKDGLIFHTYQQANKFKKLPPKPSTGDSDDGEVGEDFEKSIAFKVISVKKTNEFTE